MTDLMCSWPRSPCAGDWNYEPWCESLETCFLGLSVQLNSSRRDGALRAKGWKVD